MFYPHKQNGLYDHNLSVNKHYYIIIYIYIYLYNLGLGYLIIFSITLMYELFSLLYKYINIHY